MSETPQDTQTWAGGPPPRQPSVAAPGFGGITEPPRASRYRGRIGGIDIARALAIFGMFYAPVGREYWDSGVAQFLSQIPDGRSSILFALLAGLSLSIMTGRNLPLSGEAMRAARMRIVGRSGALFVVAAALSVLGTAVAIILAYYAAWFIAALPFTRWPAKKLFGAAAAVGIVAPFITISVTNWLLPGLGVWPGGDPNMFVLEVFVTGTYPGLVYMAFVLAGMGLGRLDLTSHTLHLRFVLYGSLMMVIGYGSSWVLTQFLADDAVSPATSASAIEVESQSTIWGSGPGLSNVPFPSLYDFVTAAPHSGTLFEVLGSGGCALAVLGICLLAGPLASTALYPLAAAGSMSLTVYSAHIVAIAFNPEWIFSDSAAPILWLVGVSIVVCPLLKLRFRRGPLEWVLWQVSNAAAHLPVQTPDVFRDNGGQLNQIPQDSSSNR